MPYCTVEATAELALVTIPSPREGVGKTGVAITAAKAKHALEEAFGGTRTSNVRRNALPRREKLPLPKVDAVRAAINATMAASHQHDAFEKYEEII